MVFCKNCRCEICYKINKSIPFIHFHRSLDVRSGGIVARANLNCVEMSRALGGGWLLSFVFCYANHDTEDCDESRVAGKFRPRICFGQWHWIVSHYLNLHEYGFQRMVLIHRHKYRISWPEILRVSPPDGVRVGKNSDPWLNEGWLLNQTRASPELIETFHPFFAFWVCVVHLRQWREERFKQTRARSF